MATNLVAYSNTNLCSGCLKSEVKVSAGLVPSGGFRGDGFPCLFPLLEAAHVPWLVAHSLHPSNLLFPTSHLLLLMTAQVRACTS